MSSKIMFPLLILAISSSVAAVNITKMLAGYSHFSTFSNLLSQTKLTDEINRQNAITVLVVANSAISPISSLPIDAQKKALAVHVILDYYDPIKLDEMQNKTALLTTLFRTSGVTTDRRMGLISYTKHSDGQMYFGSAVPGSPANSKLIKVIAARPYSISIMQVSAAILLPSIEVTTKGSASPVTASPMPVSAKNAAAAVTAETSKARTSTNFATPPSPSDALSQAH